MFDYDRMGKTVLFDMSHAILAFCGKNDLNNVKMRSK